jgi:tetratricopeptide (TPR) repeat protein
MLLETLILLLTPEAPFLPAYLASTVGAGERHQQCVRLVVEDLDEGRIGAQRWVSDGGGPPAQHCLAIADLAAGYPKLAAIRLRDLADRAGAGDETTRARILAEAALAWLDAGEIEEGRSAIDAAKARAPTLAELDFVAAKIYVADNRWQAAADAATAAEKGGVKAPEIYLIRAKALRALGRDEDAANDVVTALSIDPLDIDALTLRGELQQAGVKIEAYYGDSAPK